MPIAIESQLKEMFKDRTRVYNFGLSIMVEDLRDGKKVSYILHCTKSKYTIQNFFFLLQKNYYRKYEIAKNEHTDGSKIVIQKIPRKKKKEKKWKIALPWKIRTDHGYDIEVVLKDKDDRVVPDGIKEVDQGVHFDNKKMTKRERLETSARFVVYVSFVKTQKIHIMTLRFEK